MQRILNILIFCGIFMNVIADTKPSDFVYLSAVAPSIQQDIRYFSTNNFIGRRIQGYIHPVCILTKPAALALVKVQQALNPLGLGLKIFDGYRPQIAVDDFVQWSQQKKDQKMKMDYFPRVNKADFFKLGYIAEHSGHTRGSTVDLTIFNLKTQQELDMGTRFDFMDRRSHPLTGQVTRLQFRNRMLLRKLMLQYGFVGASTEWWHFTLKNEPYKNTYFNFLVE